MAKISKKSLKANIAKPAAANDEAAAGEAPPLPLPDDIVVPYPVLAGLMDALVQTTSMLDMKPNILNGKLRYNSPSGETVALAGRTLTAVALTLNPIIADQVRQYRDKLASEAALDAAAKKTAHGSDEEETE